MVLIGRALRFARPAGRIGNFPSNCQRGFAMRQKSFYVNDFI
jgi:hypothetical protein